MRTEIKELKEIVEKLNERNRRLSMTDEEILDEILKIDKNS